MKKAHAVESREITHMYKVPRSYVILRNLFQATKRIVSVLLVLSGGLAMLVLLITEDGALSHRLSFDTLRSIATILHAISCFASGITALMRLYRPTRVLLMGTALLVVVIAGANIPLWLGSRPDLHQAVVEWTIQYLVGATIYVLLAIWLGKPENP